MRLILADPPAKNNYYPNYPNLGILYLISFLRENIGGDKLEIFYLEGHYDLNEHLLKVKQFKPDLYGISFASQASRISCETINSIKRNLPDTKVVCGGPHPTAAPNMVFKDSLADFCVIGEGEKTLLELIQGLMGRGKHIEDIHGLAYKDGEQLILNPKRDFIEDLDSIPFPAWDLVDFKKYPGMHYKKASFQTRVSATRGCPFDCMFCSNPVWKSNKPWVRMRGPKNIAEEIDSLYTRGVREIYLCADEFNVSLKWANEVCREIIKLGRNDLYFQVNLRVDKISEEFVQNLKNMNTWLVQIGIESGSQRVLDGIGKHITIEQVYNSHYLFKKYPIKVLACMMLYQIWEENGNLCCETTEEVEKSVNLMRKLFSRKLIHYFSWQVATPLPGSRMWHIANKYNLLSNENDYGHMQDPCLNIPGISRKEMQRMVRKGLVFKNFYAVRSGDIKINRVFLSRVWENLKIMLR